MHSPVIKSLVALAVITSMSAAISVHAADLGPQSSEAGGVAIQVTPIEISPMAKEWKFAVTLNTHSQNLGEDLAAEAFIIDSAGKPQPAIGWEGDAPGGHHRKGVLRFAPQSPTPAQIEVRIRRAGESQPRAFRWSSQ